jgi:hypothetical protein
MEPGTDAVGRLPSKDLPQPGILFMLDESRPGAVEAQHWHDNCPPNNPEEENMQYMFARMLGVPGVVVVAWFLLAHQH